MNVPGGCTLKGRQGRLGRRISWAAEAEARIYFLMDFGVGGFQGFRGGEGGLPAVLMSAVPWFGLEKGQGRSSVCFAGKM